MSAPRGPRISVGVPVWQGAGFVAETLDCVLSQRDVAVEVFISIDGADHESERACRPFASNPRVRIAVQPQRLGWGENCAAALAGAAAAGAPYVCLQPHDDLVDSEYLRTLAEVQRRAPTPPSCTATSARSEPITTSSCSRM